MTDRRSKGWFLKSHLGSCHAATAWGPTGLRLPSGHPEGRGHISDPLVDNGWLTGRPSGKSKAFRLPECDFRKEHLGTTSFPAAVKFCVVRRLAKGSHFMTAL